MFDNQFTHTRRSILGVLDGGDVVGIRPLVEAVARRPLSYKQHDLLEFRRVVAELQALIQFGYVANVACKDRVRFVLLKPADTGKRFALGWFAAFVVPFLGLSFVGCAAPRAATDTPPRAMLMGYPTFAGIGQIRSPEGRALFVPCDPCAPPTAKTPVVAFLGEPRARSAVPDNLPDALPVSNAPLQILANPVIAGPTARVHVAAAPIMLTPSPALHTAAPVDSKGAPTKPASATIYFGFATHTVSDKGMNAISRVVSHAAPIERIEIVGHADARGPNRANQAISLQRAYSVRDVLLKAGVDKRVIKVSACADCYVADNNTPGGRQMNRRVVVDVVYGKRTDLI